jgi:hypothetical protein
MLQALIELFDLTRGEGADSNQYWWQESARWLKYEENYTADVNQWSRPHVALLNFYALTYTRKCFSKGGG